MLKPQIIYSIVRPLVGNWLTMHSQNHAVPVSLARHTHTTHTHTHSHTHTHTHTHMHARTHTHTHTTHTHTLTHACAHTHTHTHTHTPSLQPTPASSAWVHTPISPIELWGQLMRESSDPVQPTLLSRMGPAPRPNTALE